MLSDDPETIKFEGLNVTNCQNLKQQRLLHKFIHVISIGLHYIRLISGHVLECLLKVKTKLDFVSSFHLV